MNKDIERKIISILEILNNATEPVGASFISEKLLERGIELSERAVRYHLKLMDERGFTKVVGKKGRLITEKGREEIKNALVSDKLGFIISKIENLAFHVTLDKSNGKGNVVLNLSIVPKKDLKKALNIIGEILKKGYGISEKVIIFEREDEEIVPGIIVPEKKAIIGTLCSVTIHGILIKNGIPVNAKLGGVLEIKAGETTRFLEAITYQGSTLDPLEILIKSGMTSVINTVRRKEGKILATFREIPLSARDETEKILEEIKEIGLSGKILLGKPNQEILAVPVTPGTAGLVIAGGLNPLAGVIEAGIDAENKAMSIIYKYEDLIPIKELLD
ncbi:MAG TPA: NrpR regulatory domain-containing protein [Dictyoglomaceae bacterium]|nr:NrpR regulatory domain-containing protein [Dictyoglomaceae bacterium]HOL39577.1 NrpR regulatory domain-containing protein [Dictyoglomaceae bacterium]HOP94966.1 NrpR regulatory domain-containing protein [Dictyoglomaceae bacterium]HPP16471.1 NrpR regulatory domain-containing protein [Dictyoglomaceae bacterium]